jgi:hypothetical protein
MSTAKKGSLRVYRNKMMSERALIENLIFMDTKEYCDTISISENLLAKGMVEQDLTPNFV